jgi:hypothetical protein
MSLDLNNSSEVQTFVAELREQGITIIVVDTLSERLRGNSALYAAADNVIDARDGEAKFLKRRDGTPAVETDEYLIWSNEHRGWWRPDSRGYSPGLREAGRYTREQAMRICREAVFTSMHVGMISEIPVRACDIADFLKGQMVPAAVFDGAR